MSNRKVVTELTKLWDAVVTKGKLTMESRVANDGKTWVAGSPVLTSFQTTFNEKYDMLNKFHKDMISKQMSAEGVAERTKEKFGKLMSTYEEFIGIREVRTAHSRVLSSEAKFIDCQEKRRQASKELSEIYNKLLEIRAELDRTNRGDETYLDLVKEEIAATKQERIMRKQFEELERAEREVFAELSSALRISHEKERAQNEKTKYWSVVGSIIGAGLGILGTTVNNRIRQNNFKQILAETSSQVTSIQNTVDNLVRKMNETTLTADHVARIVEGSRSRETEETILQKKVTKAMQESLKMLQQLILINPSYRNEKLPPVLVDETPTSFEADIKQLVVEHKWPITAVACCMLYVIYKLV